MQPHELPACLREAGLTNWIREPLDDAESVGYRYPETYIGYIHRKHEAACRHRWYMTSRLITINDIHSFDPGVAVDFDEFEDVVGLNFRQPAEGLGFDGSPVAHMWRTMTWPNNFL